MATKGFHPELKETLLPKDPLESKKDDIDRRMENKSCIDYCYDSLPAPPTSRIHRPETCYDQWLNSCDCYVFEPEVNQLLISSSRPDRYAGEMCRICMSPVYCLDRITYKLCCCGDYQNCSCCCIPGGVYCLCILTVPKLPCILLSAVGGGIGWVVGSIQNLLCGSDEEAKEIKEEKRQTALLNPTDRGEKLQINMEVCIKNSDLLTIVKYLQTNHLDIDQICAAMATEFGLGLRLLCLVLNYEKEDVLLKERKWLIIHLLRNGVYINGIFLPSNYQRPIQFLVPLYEALTSRYSDAHQLVAFLCERGANVKMPVAMKYKQHWIETSIFDWACIRYYSYPHEDQRQEFFKKMAALQNAAKKNNFSNYIAARELLSSKFIEVEGILDIIGGYSCRFFKPVVKTVKPEIKQALEQAKKVELVDSFGVFVEFNNEDRFGFRTVPSEHDLALTIHPQAPRGERPAGP